MAFNHATRGLLTGTSCPANFKATIALDALSTAIFEWEKRRGGAYGEKESIIESRLLRLKWVEETCFNHCSWCLVDLDTARADVASRRLAATQEKIERIYWEVKKG